MPSDADLQRVVNAWSELSDDVRQQVLALVSGSPARPTVIAVGDRTHRRMREKD